MRPEACLLQSHGGMTSELQQTSLRPWSDISEDAEAVASVRWPAIKPVDRALEKVILFYASSSRPHTLVAQGRMH
jgi:hypothetical protein